MELRFADNTSLLAEDEHDLHYMVDRLDNTSSRFRPSAVQKHQQV